MSGLFQNKKPKMQRLAAYGFAAQGQDMVFSAPLLEGQFLLTVTLCPNGTVCDCVTDTATGEEYVLHRVPGACGGFVGHLREEYLAALEHIAQNYFEPDVFKTTQAAQVIEYVAETYGCRPEYLWERTPNNAIWRRTDNRKWFAAILTISPTRLGLPEGESIEILDLRILPEELPGLLDGKNYFPGYHMNKRHWFTLCLDSSLPLQEICRRIDQSYQLAAKK